MDPQMAELPLRDIHAAAVPGLWPPAPGWWLLAALALAALVLAIRWAWRRHRRLKFARALRAEWQGLTARHAASQDAHRLTAEAATLLRRLIVHVGGRRDAAALVGSAWAEYLAAVDATDPEMKAVAVALAEAPYRPDAEVDAQALDGLVDRWIRRTLQEVARV